MNNKTSYNKRAKSRRSASSQPSTAVAVADRGVDGKVGSRHRVDWPAALDSAAFHGLAGQIVQLIEPNSEADPAALLGQFLVAFGNVVGRTPFFQVEATRHYPNLFLAVVGDTAKARKGTSWNQIRRVFGLVSPDFAKRTVDGLSSGEGLIWEVRDPLDEADESGDGAAMES